MTLKNYKIFMENHWFIVVIVRQIDPRLLLANFFPFPSSLLPFQSMHMHHFVLCTSIQHAQVLQCATPIFSACSMHQYSVRTTFVPHTNIQCAQILYFTPIFSVHNFFTMHLYSVRTTFTPYTNIQCAQHLYHAPIFNVHNLCIVHEYSVHTNCVPCTNIQCSQILYRAQIFNMHNFCIAHQYFMSTTISTPHHANI